MVSSVVTVHAPGLRSGDGIFVVGLLGDFVVLVLARGEGLLQLGRSPSFDCGDFEGDLIELWVELAWGQKSEMGFSVLAFAADSFVAQVSAMGV